MAELFTSEDPMSLSALLERELGLNLRSEELTTAAVSIVRFACAKMLRQKSLGRSYNAGSKITTSDNCHA